MALTPQEIETLTQKLYELEIIKLNELKNIISQRRLTRSDAHMYGLLLVEKQSKIEINDFDLPSLVSQFNSILEFAPNTEFDFYLEQVDNIDYGSNKEMAIMYTEVTVLTPTEIMKMVVDFRLPRAINSVKRKHIE